MYIKYTLHRFSKLGFLVPIYQSCTVDVFATHESEHIENDELEKCARHLTFSDFIARYYMLSKHTELEIFLQKKSV